jgi:hypothetical protein
MKIHVFSFVVGSSAFLIMEAIYSSISHTPVHVTCKNANDMEESNVNFNDFTKFSEDQAGPAFLLYNHTSLRDSGWVFPAVYIGRIPEPALDTLWTSQVGQDKSVSLLFNYKTSGFFVDLAANDAVALSNTLTLEQQYGWRGVCIEANPRYYPMLYKRKCLVVQAAVGRQDNEQVGFAMRDAFGGFIGDGFDNHGMEGNSTLFTTVSLRSLFRDLQVPPVIDYLSLDVEGAEEYIFQDFPWSEYRFLAMTVERPKPGLVNALRANGYLYVRNHGDFGDEMWVHSTFPDLDAALVRLQT